MTNPQNIVVKHLGDLPLDLGNAMTRVDDMLMTVYTTSWSQIPVVK